MTSSCCIFLALPGVYDAPADGDWPITVSAGVLEGCPETLEESARCSLKAIERSMAFASFRVIPVRSGITPGTRDPADVEGDADGLGDDGAVVDLAPGVLVGDTVAAIDGVSQGRAPRCSVEAPS